MNLENILKSKRPNLKQTTLQTYAISLKLLHRHIVGDDNVESIDFAKDHAKVIDYISKYQANTRKGYLNALITLLKCDVLGTSEACKIYIEHRDGYNKAYQEKQSSGELNEKQKKNWVSWAQYRDMVGLIAKDVKTRRLRSKRDLDPEDMRLYGDLVLTSLYVELPLRNDFADVKVISTKAFNKLGEEEQRAHNYLTTKTNEMTLVLNNYKTDAKYGTKKFVLSAPLRRLIVGWLKHNTTGELLYNIGANGITKTLNRITKTRLGKTIGSSMLRHIYLSSKYAALEAEKDKDAEKMLHSKSTAQEIYIKKPPQQGS